MPTFEPDLDKLRALWGSDPPADSFEDFLTVTIESGDGLVQRSPTHVFGRAVRVLPYHDLDGEENVQDADATPYPRGDQALAEIFKPGEFGYMMKHHRGEAAYQGRRIAPPMAPDAMRAHLKLQDTHVALVIGVADRAGHPGVITVHNPQGYPHNKGREDRTDQTWEQKKRFVGRFGEPEYSMVFFKPSFPSYTCPAVARAMVDNICTMGVGFNAVNDYPSENYDGHDPLAAYDVERIREHAAHMVRAIAGDEAGRKESLEWFKQDAHQLYCSEFAHVATSAGIHCPLNAATFVPLVGEPVWLRFAEMVACHNRGGEAPFQTLNKNPLIHHVGLSLAPEDLRPLPHYAPAELREAEARKLAFPPLNAKQIIELAMAELFPDDRRPDAKPDAGGRAERLKHFCPDLLAALAGDPADPHPQTGAAQLTGAAARPDQLASDSLFVPPSLLHFVAKGHCPDGLLGLNYEGHGLHFSLVRPRKD